MLIARVAVPAPVYPFDRLFDYKIPVELENSIKVGSLVELLFNRRKTWGLVFEVLQKSELPLEKLKPLKALLIEEPIASQEKLDFFKWLSSSYFYPLGHVCEAAIPSIIRKGTKARTKKAQKKAAPPKDFLHLNKEQHSAYEKILHSTQKTHLLWGVTGSGKTEVFLHLIKKAQEKNKGTLILVPEIALTPQLFSRFEERFPGKIALFHSAQKPSKIRENFHSVLNKEKNIVIGARSAIFAPLENIHFIIVDEEHDGSYKQDDRLRYNLRDAAEKLNEFYPQSKLVFASATPRIESYKKTLDNKWELHTIKNRAHLDSTLPALEIIDLNKNLPQKNLDPEAHAQANFDSSNFEDPKDLYLSQKLKSRIKECLEKNEQSILFLNRRGLAKFLLCEKCNLTPECPSCQVSLTPHKNKLICHYCFYYEQHPFQCKECSGRALKEVGLGTQSLETLIQKEFPEARTLRLDRDSTQKKGSLEENLKLFKEHKADILLGTQMVAKGHDFPNVTLVGIIIADSTLLLPDFRSQERSLQLLYQVSGRAGRSEKKGTVCIQSFNPSNPFFSYLNQENPLDAYKNFLEDELQKREALFYPPYSKLALIKFDSLNEGKVEECAKSFAQALNKSLNSKNQLRGPTPSALYKIQNRFRWTLLIKTGDPKNLKASLNWLTEKWWEKKLEKHFQTRMIIDVDPETIL